MSSPSNGSAWAGSSSSSEHWHASKPSFSTESYRGSSDHLSELTLPQTLKAHAIWAWQGLLDASNLAQVLEILEDDREIRANFVKSLLLNLLSLVFIYVFDFLLHPLVRDNPRQDWVHRNFGSVYQLLWIAPVVGGSVYMNTRWCNHIANRAYARQHGPRAGVASYSSTSSGNSALLHTITTSAYRWIMIATSVGLDIILRFVPYTGVFASGAFLCWVNSYYFFEYAWTAQAHSLPRRVRDLEERWAYYLGFGMPSAVICMFGTGLASPALFALIFPYYILLALHGTSLPRDPYHPQPPVLYRSRYGESADSAAKPSRFVPIRLPVFAPVLFLNDVIFRILEVALRTFGVEDASVAAAGGAFAASYGFTAGSGGVGPRASRYAENVEEGQMDNLGYTTSGAVQSGGTPQPRIRIARKSKLD